MNSPTKSRQLHAFEAAASGNVNQLIIASLTAEIERVRSDEDFTSRAKRLIERDKELLERLGR